MGAENHSVHRASDAAPEPRNHRRGQGLPAPDSCCAAYQEVLISADGWSGAWTCRASRRRLADCRKRRRATLVEIRASLKEIAPRERTSAVRAETANSTLLCRVVKKLERFEMAWLRILQS